MRIHIFAIGRARAGPEAALYEHYADRIKRWPVRLVEHEVRGRAAPGRLAEAEAELLAKPIPQGAYMVALDERGTQFTSRGFAEFLRNLEDTGHGDVAFLIGGAEGLAAGLRERADKILSLGQATWPHLLVRGLLAEQIYRAQQIIAGHPYHRD